MLNDLRRYITNCDQYSNAIMFFYMICERIEDTKLLNTVLDCFVNGLDDAIDVYPPSYWITRINDVMTIEDYFGLGGSFIIEMLLRCFHVEYDFISYSDCAANFWLNNRFKVFDLIEVKRPKSNLAIELDNFLKELDEDFYEYFRVNYKNNKFSETDFIDEFENSYFDYIEIRLLNKCERIEELEIILEEIGFIKAKRGVYYWAGYYYEDGGISEEYLGFDVTVEVLDNLKSLQTRNDVSEYSNLFDRMEFEDGEGLYKLINQLNTESFNKKDVIF